MAHEKTGPVLWGPRWGKPVGRILAHGYYNTKVTGSGNVPADGPVIFAGNHIGYLDGPLMYGVAPRPMHVMVKQEFFDNPLGKLLKYAGSIPLDRTGDRKALADALGVLKMGRCVGILPEGTRGNGRAESLATGVAWLAVQSGAPIVPVAILGTRTGSEPVNVVPTFRRRFAIDFGEPITPDQDPGLSGRARMAHTVTQIQQRLSAHISAAVASTGIDLPFDTKESA